jgi:hypothetical protein
MAATCRAPVPCRRARTDAGDALGRKALDAATVAIGASIKAGERSTAKRETLNAVPCRCGRTDAGAAIGWEALDAGMVASGAGSSTQPRRGISWLSLPPGIA